MIRILLLCLIFFLLNVASGDAVRANHIVGGELNMRPLGTANLYEVTLLQFWDQNNLIIPTETEGGNRDAQADLFIFRKSDNRLMDRVTVNYQSTELIQYQNKACANLRSLNTSIGTYRGNVTLDRQQYNDPAGYYIVWERCCRNDDINNIVAPGENGMVFYLEFPPLSITNSSPRFVSPNGQYICSKRPFSMNMSATDADGDELRYSLVTPMRGYTDPSNLQGDGTPKKSFPLVTWSAGISDSNVIPGSSPLAISNTGMLTVNADHIGLYVFAIQCDEYRNGKKIGQIRRDFQLLVIDCNNDQPGQPVIMMNDQPVQAVTFCPKQPVQLETESSTAWSYQWQFNGQNIPGATTATLAVQDTGVYSVVKSYSDKCSRDTSSLNVHVGYADPVPAKISMARDTICKDETLTLLANDGNIGSLKAGWYSTEGLLPATSAAMDVQAGGTYILVLTDDQTGCSGSDTAMVVQEDLQVTLPEQQTISRGTEATVRAEVMPAAGSYSYAWSPGDGVVNGQSGQVLTVAPQQETTYTVEVTSRAGCVALASTLIKVIDKLHIPTAFTPNNDGVNDTFEIYNSEDQIVDVRIYNRWGEVVFQSAGYPAPWDGTFKNKLADAGVYPYSIQTSTGKVNGTITLIR